MIERISSLLMVFVSSVICYLPFVLLGYCVSEIVIDNPWKYTLYVVTLVAFFLSFDLIHRLFIYLVNLNDLETLDGEEIVTVELDSHYFPFVLLTFAIASVIVSFNDMSCHILLYAGFIVFGHWDFLFEQVGYYRYKIRIGRCYYRVYSKLKYYDLRNGDFRHKLHRLSHDSFILF